MDTYEWFVEESGSEARGTFGPFSGYEEALSFLFDRQLPGGEDYLRQVRIFKESK